MSVACRPPPAADPASARRLAALEARLAALETGTGLAGGDGVPATPEARVARLEQRLDRIVAFLEQAVPPKLDDSLTYALPIDPSDPVAGPADAKVTVIEVFEFLCPYCASVAPVIAELRARHPRDVRVVSKYYVIHGPVAEPPGRAACAAARQGQAKYMAFETAAWASLWPGGAGSPPVKEHAAEAEMIEVAKAAGLDVARFRADLTGPACAAWMERTSDVLSRFGVPGTPSFYVNGRIVDGGGEALEQAVTEAIAEVTRSGVAPARYYQDVVMKTGEPHARTVSPFD